MLSNEITMLNKIYNTLSLITTKGQETLYMARCLDAVVEIIDSLTSKNIVEETITIPLEDIINEQKEE